MAGSAGRKSKMDAGLETGLFCPPLVPMCHVGSIARLEKVLNHPMVFQT